MCVCLAAVMMMTMMRVRCAIVGVSVLLLHHAAAQCPPCSGCDGTSIRCGNRGLTSVPNVTWDGTTEELWDMCGGAIFSAAELWCGDVTHHP